jgi:hypothetical protein
VSGRLNISPALLDSPAAELDSPGLAVVYLTATGSYLAFTTPGAARQLAAACTRAAELLEGPQVVPAT